MQVIPKLHGAAGPGGVDSVALSALLKGIRAAAAGAGKG